MEIDNLLEACLIFKKYGVKNPLELKSIRDKYNKGIKEKYPKEYKSALNPV